MSFGRWVCGCVGVWVCGCVPEFGQLLQPLVQRGGVEQTGLHGAVGGQRQVPADALQNLRTQRGGDGCCCVFVLEWI